MCEQTFLLRSITRCFIHPSIQCFLSVQPRPGTTEFFLFLPVISCVSTLVCSLRMFTVTFLADLKYRALPCNKKIRETHENSRFLLFFPASVVVCCLMTQLCPTHLQPHGLQPTRLLCPCDFPGKNIGVSCHTLLQGIFLTQVSNPRLLHCKQILHC